MKRSQKGFTLIELIVYAAILSLILLSTTLLYYTVSEAKRKNRITAEVESQGIQLTEIITQTVRNAKAINSPAVGATATTLSLQMAAAGVNPSLFTFGSNKLTITEGAGSAVDLNNDKVKLNNLIFENHSLATTPGIINFSFDISYNNSSGNAKYDFSKKFYGAASIR